MMLNYLPFSMDTQSTLSTLSTEMLECLNRISVSLVGYLFEDRCSDFLESDSDIILLPKFGATRINIFTRKAMIIYLIKSYNTASLYI